MNTIKKSYPVLEMSCASCAASVESILKSQKGIVNASVNFAAATVLLIDESSFIDALIIEQ
ncbi:MAG: heavy metal-associated domain-containing protein [Bacteroidales bacterium]|jgi:P-type Cu2+ transporter